MKPFVPPGVCIMDEGSGVDFGGGVDGAVTRLPGCGEGDAARYMRRSAPSFLGSKGLERRRADLGRGEGVRGMIRGGEDWMRVGPVEPEPEWTWKERVGRSLSSDSEAAERSSAGIVEVSEAKERPTVADG